MKSNTRAATAVAAAVLCAAAVGGCSGDDSGGGPEAAPAISEAAASDSASVSAPASPSPSVDLSKVSAKEIAPYGKILVNAKDWTLYLFDADKPNESTCTGECAKAWRPLLVTSAPKADRGGVKQKLLSTTTRDDNTMQVTYNGHPLYTYQGDKKAGETRGQALTQFGAKWYVVDTDGKKVTVLPPPGSASPSPSTSPSTSPGSSTSPSPSTSPGGSTSPSATTGPTGSPSPGTGPGY
jgi:predicted lipoprotein with Yx(FWY)xxD motif